MALGSTQPLTEMSTRNLPGVKSGRCVGLTNLPPSVSQLSENVGASTSRNTKGIHGLYRDTSTFTNTSQGLWPCHLEEVCMPQWLGDLCWRECKLLVGLPMPNGSKNRGQKKCSPWSSWLGLGMKLMTPSWNILLYETVEEAKTHTKKMKN
jgi:hypothetical protein